MDSAESAGGRLGAVLSSPRSGVVALGPPRPVAGHHARPGPAGPDRRTELRLPGRREPQRRPVRQPGRHALGPRRLRARCSPSRSLAGWPSSTAEWDAALAAHDRATPGRAVRRHAAAASSRGAIHDVRGPALARPRRSATTSPTWCSTGSTPWVRSSPLDALPAGGAAHVAASATRAWRSRTPWPPSPTSTAHPEDSHDARRRHPGSDRRRRLAAGLARQPPDDGRRPGARRLGDAAPDPSHVDHRPHHHARGGPRGSACPAGRVVLVSPLLLGRLHELVPGRPRRPARLRPRPVAGRDAAPGRLAPVRRRSARVPGPPPRHGPPRPPRRVGALARHSR